MEQDSDTSGRQTSGLPVFHMFVHLLMETYSDPTVNTLITNQNKWLGR